MEELQNFLKIFKEPMLQFFAWMAVLYILASVFVDRRIAFWISSLGTSYLWVKNQDPRVALRAWAVIGSVLFLLAFFKYLFNLNLLLFLKGKKRCPMCCEEARRKAKVCPYCGYSFAPKEEECK